ncbi:MAG: bacteriohemerythrin [Tenuifilaceae bacterium]|jgi:hemerythrin-like metal-binding protein|uniref:bacteriohemerythrin n=1 Tax=Perlabentimonas gracilis TaxID=2715279 RepID=UPI001407FECF|nr:bacteriohemerythrin [Perlabentimonas gracilis]MDX9769781.1 bacteriohemerythrin [Tenuifilaceae bacterium]NHB70118.1 hemerythrin family protein [Perlabentimonas gracilis]
MAFFTWQNKFAFDIESIDNDHKKLVGYIDDLYSAMSQGQAKNIIQGVVKELIDYTRVHFRREEFYMKSTNYPDFESHKKAHDAFVEQVDAFEDKLNQGKDNISIEVLTFLREWLSEHILNTDKKLVPHLKDYGIK